MSNGIRCGKQIGRTISVTLPRFHEVHMLNEIEKEEAENIILIIPAKKNKVTLTINLTN